VRKTLTIFSAAALLLSTGSAVAYVGPGAGISVLGALWGLIVGIIMAVGVILFWPIRMMIRKRKAAKAEAAAQKTGELSTDADPQDSKTS
jgi:hypothetical protein